MKILERLVDKTSLVNVTNASTALGVGIITTGSTMVSTGIPNVMIMGGVLIVVGAVISIIKG